jgi:hypothetical protein
MTKKQELGSSTVKLKVSFYRENAPDNEMTKQIKKKEKTNKWK